MSGDEPKPLIAWLCWQCGNYFKAPSDSEAVTCDYCGNTATVEP